MLFHPFKAKPNNLKYLIPCQYFQIRQVFKFHLSVEVLTHYQTTGTDGKHFAGDKSTVAKTKISVHNIWTENTGKRRKCCLQTFSPFSTMFLSSYPILAVVKNWDCVVKG